MTVFSPCTYSYQNSFVFLPSNSERRTSLMPPSILRNKSERITSYGKYWHVVAKRKSIYICPHPHPPPHQCCIYTNLSYTRFSNQSKVFSSWVSGNRHINNHFLFEFSLRICFDVFNNGLYPFLESQLVFCFILLCNIVLCGCMDISVRSEGELGRIYWKAYWSGRNQHFSNIEKYVMTL